MVLIVVAEGDQPGDVALIHRLNDIVDGHHDIIGGITSTSDIVAGEDDEVRRLIVQNGLDQLDGPRIGILVILCIGKLHDFKAPVVIEPQVKFPHMAGLGDRPDTGDAQRGCCAKA